MSKYLPTPPSFPAPASLPLRAAAAGTARRRPFAAFVALSLLLAAAAADATLAANPEATTPAAETPATAPAAEVPASEAQPAEVRDPALTAMEAIADMAGTWEGEGWMRMGPGEPSRFHSSETVESRLDGRVLVIEGLHHARTEDGGKGPAVHHALALVHWDARDQQYDFRSYVAGRGDGDFAGRMEDGAFVWGGETPQGHMRYVIRVDGDTWEETGELSRDGETWMPFFGMTLKRVGG